MVRQCPSKNQIFLEQKFVFQFKMRCSQTRVPVEVPLSISTPCINQKNGQQPAAQAISTATSCLETESRSSNNARPWAVLPVTLISLTLTPSNIPPRHDPSSSRRHVVCDNIMSHIASGKAHDVDVQSHYGQHNTKKHEHRYWDNTDYTAFPRTLSFAFTQTTYNKDRHYSLE